MDSAGVEVCGEAAAEVGDQEGNGISVNESETASDASKVALPRSVKVVGLASLLNDTASEMIYPLLPHFLLNVLLGNRFYLGVIEGIADSVASFVKLWSGDRSDQAGQRKGFIVFGYCVPALVRPLIGLTVAPWQLFGIRVLDRIGKGVRSSPRDALIADSTDHSIRGRAFGFHRAMDNLGAAIGPLLAAGFLWLWPNELRTLFLIAFVPGLLVVMLLVFGLREKTIPQPTHERLRLTLKPFDRSFRVYLLSLVVFTLGNSSDVFLLVRAGELGVPTAMLPLLWCACHIAKSASNLLLGRTVDRIGSRPALFLGWLAFAGVYLAFGVATSVWEVWTFFIVYGLACGLIEPAERALVGHLVGVERKGLAYGWYNFAIGIATLPSSLIFGGLYQYFGPIVAFVWGSGLALIAAIILMGVAVKPIAKSA
jgi:MFS family permease